MTAAAKSGRSRGVGQTPPRDPVQLGEITTLATRVTKDLVGLPLDYGDTVTQICGLLAGDPRNEAHLAAVVEVVVADALADPFRETHANRWRPRLPSWLRPPMVGVTVRLLGHLGVLVSTGRYVRSTDLRGGNTNKLVPVYALNLSALLDHDPAATVAKGA